jgi:hypothetical protein
MKFKFKKNTRTLNKRQKKRKTKQRKTRKSYKKVRLMKGGIHSNNSSFVTPKKPEHENSIITYIKTPSKTRSVGSDTEYESSNHSIEKSTDINYYNKDVPESAALYPIGSSYKGHDKKHIVLSDVKTGAGGTITINDGKVTKRAFPEEDNLKFEYLVGEFLQEMASDFNDCFIKFYNVVNIERKRSENTPTLIESDNLQSLSMPYIKGKTLGAFLRESWDSNGQEKLNTFYCILLQVYTALYCYQNVFTHGDLHVENVLLEEAPNNEEFTFDFNKESKSDNATTIFDFPSEEPFITFTCKYKIKIIDFGRAWYPGVEEICNYVENQDTEKELHNARTKVCLRRNHPQWTIHNQNVSQDLRLLQSCIDCLPTYSEIEISSREGKNVRKCQLFDIPFIFNDEDARIIPPNNYEMHYKTEEIVESGYANNIIYNIVDAMYFLADLVEPVNEISTYAITKTIKKITLDDIRMKYKINLDESFAAVDDTQYKRTKRTKRTFDQISKKQ